MSVQPKTRSKKIAMILFVAAIYLSNFAVMTEAVMVPISESLYTYFTGHEMAVNFILSGPAICIVISSLFVPLLLKRINKRTLMIVTYGIYSLAAFFGASIDSLWWLLFTRMIIGLCIGIINVVAIAYISEYFSDNEKLRANIMGFNSFVSALIGGVMSAVAGVFAMNGWQSGYDTYKFSVVVFILLLLFLPKAKKEEQVVVENTEKTPFPVSKILGICVAAITFNCIFFIMAYQISLYIAENQLGTTAFVGTLNSANLLASCVASVLFGVIFTKFRNVIVSTFFACAAIAFGIAYFMPSATSALIAYTLMGLFYGLSMCYFYMIPSVILPEKHVDTGISLLIASMGIGTFLSTYTMSLIKTILGTATVTPTFLPICLISVLLCVLYIVLAIRDKKKEAN